MDPLGDVVPLTPVVSVEPTDPGVTPEMICSLLTAPAMSALMHTRVAGTGMTSEAFRVSASTLAALPVPTDLQRWRTLTAELPGGGSDLPVTPGAMRDLSPILNRISADCISWEGTDRADAEHRLVEWWLERLPRSYRDP